MSEARIVLVKPGDVLIFGNVTVDVDNPVLTETMASLKEMFGLAGVLVFDDDIDLAVQQSSDAARSLPAAEDSHESD